MSWADIAKQIAALGLPLLGAALPLPGGAAIGAALAAVLQTPDKTPAGVLTALTTSAADMAQARHFEEQRSDALLQVAIDAEASDRASARALASSDIAKGNAFTSFLAAVIRPAFGFTALAAIIHAFVTGIDLSPHVAPILDDVVQFYFGARVIEKIMPHIAGTISSFSGK